MRPLRILTWHIHGSYLYYLVQSGQIFYLPVKPGRPEGYGGRSGSFPWPKNAIDVPADEVRDLEFDCILFQSRKNYFEDQYEILTERQRQLPRVYLEHDPPREHPTDTRHPVDDPEILLVHVTPFNDLMWDSGSTPTRVIDHGVLVPENIRYTGELESGIVVVNGLRKRGRRLGVDIFERVRRQVPLELAGMESEELGGMGNVALTALAALEARHRFFFNPIRYTSLGLAVCEAMMLGMPILGLATTEMSTAVVNGVSGYVETSLCRLIDHMRALLRDPQQAQMLGAGAREIARERFGIERFVRDWDGVFEEVVSMRGGWRLPVSPMFAQTGEAAVQAAERKTRGLQE